MGAGRDRRPEDGCVIGSLNDVLKPERVGVIIKATHHCMTARGGVFRDDALTRQELLGLAKSDE
ncbi:GTP cyclohydrolase I [Bradyrhizobium nitroreducens]|uniref:GTP cyclohydrolase I n=1 Tax=Bradyrhizobium nitroreducens TaxID=709803 RepID=UPI00269E73B0